MIKFLFAFTFLLFSKISLAQYPIYIALTHPRATATAFEMIFRTTDELEVMHAPFLNPYIVQKYPQDHAFVRLLPNPTVTFEEIINDIMEKAQHTPVFIKESAYVLLKYMQHNLDFFKRDQVKLLVYVRNPAKSIISLYRKLPSVDDSVIGHRELRQVYELLKSHKPILVIDSDNFLNNPKSYLTLINEHWSLNIDKSNLAWEPQFASDWHLKSFYSEVSSSQELGGPTPEIELDIHELPMYDEVKNEEDKKRLQGLYKIHFPFYQKLLTTMRPL